jgi:hypothetical protein
MVEIKKITWTCFINLVGIENITTRTVNLWGSPPSRESFFSFFKFCYYQFLPSPTLICYYHIWWMVNSRSSSWDWFVTGPLNWGTVCRIYINIVIHYVRLQDIGNVQKILFFIYSLHFYFQLAFTMLLKYCFLITYPSNGIKWVKMNV